MIRTIAMAAVLCGGVAACGGGGTEEATETCQRQDVSIAFPAQQVEQDTACEMEPTADLKLRFVNGEEGICQPVLVAVTELGSSLSRVNIASTFDDVNFSSSGAGVRSYLLADRLSSHVVIGEFSPPQQPCSASSLKVTELSCALGESNDSTYEACGNVVFENTEIFQNFTPPVR